MHLSWTSIIVYEYSKEEVIYSSPVFVLIESQKYIVLSISIELEIIILDQSIILDQVIKR